MSILVRIARHLARRRLAHALEERIRHLHEAPLIAARRTASALLARLREEPGPAVCLGETTWGEPIQVPLIEIVRACGLTTGGMGTGKTMFALLPLEAIVRRLPHLPSMSFGVLDAKGELFERALWLLARRLRELSGPEEAALRERIVIIDFSSREAVSPYNILARWPNTEPDYFITSRLETLRELLPAGERLSLRGTSVLRYALALLAEFGLPLTYLEHVLSSEEVRARLVARSRQEAVRVYFDRHFAREGAQTIAALRARMDALFASDGVRLALAGSTAPDFRRLQNEGKIILVNCAGPTITRGVRLLLQGLILSDIRQSIFARPNQPPVTYLWCADEAQNFFLTRSQQENMADILTMGRSFGTFFYFLCQNLSTAVPDARILETLHTNTRWSLTLRSTPHDALFLRPALPVTGRLRRPEANPFQDPGFYSTAEEREITHSGIANLPDREGYLWLKAHTPEAIQILTRRVRMPDVETFRRAIEVLRRDARLGARISRAAYDRLIAERDREWLAEGGAHAPLDVDPARLRETYTPDGGGAA